ADRAERFRQLHEAGQHRRAERRLGSRRPGPGAGADRLSAGRRSAGEAGCGRARRRPRAGAKPSLRGRRRDRAVRGSRRQRARPVAAQDGGRRGEARRRQAGRRQGAQAAQASRRQAKEEVAPVEKTDFSMRDPERVPPPPAMSSARQSRAPLHAIYLVLAALVFAAMALATKVAAARLPGPQIAFVRFLIGLGACAIARTRVRMQARNKVGLLMRGAFGGAAVLCFFLGIAHLPVGIATLLNYTAPVFTAVYAALFLGEAITPTTLGALGLTTVGVVMVMLGTAPAGSFVLGRWQLVGVLSAMLSGAAVATIREVRKTDGSWEIFAAFCAAGAAICVVPAVRDWVAPTPREWLV